MITGTILSLIVAFSWLRKSWTRWPKLFGVDDFVFAVFMAVIIFPAGVLLEYTMRIVL